MADYPDLVKRLREENGPVSMGDVLDAAAEIERLGRERDHERAMWEKANNAEAIASRRADAAEAALATAREALELLTDLHDAAGMPNCAARKKARAALAALPPTPETTL